MNNVDVSITAPQIQRILDEKAVRDVHLRYCRGVDRQDWDLVRSCFHSGAIDNHGPYNGDAPEGFISFAKEFLDAIEGTTHFTGNQLVEVESDVAWHEAYCVSYERIKATEDYPRTDRTVVFRYFDRMERRDGRWGIVDRVVIVDSERQDPVVDASIPVPPWHMGSADRSDPSYNREKPQAEFLAAGDSRVL
jgi:hypothetical protein